ncbi:MAG: leucine-rich repeat protein [Paludibacter sp.]|jgi:hypothetical protein|nr:leucine-rich repeat protein [Paludibacter sp.]
MDTVKITGVTRGSLSGRLAAHIALKLTSLEVSGELDKQDMEYLSYISREGILSVLDLKNADFLYNGAYVTAPKSMRYCCLGSKTLQIVMLPRSYCSKNIHECFNNCVNLKEIEIDGSNNNPVFFNSFQNCPKIEKINILNNMPNLDEKSFDMVDKNKCEVYVPNGTKNDYSIARGWHEFKNVIENTN